MKGTVLAFLDGFTGAGLYEPLKPPCEFRRAMIAMACGFTSFAAIMVSFCVLVTHDHQTAAYILICMAAAGHFTRPFLRRD